MANLLSVDTNAKTVKGKEYGFNTAIMYLKPWKLANGTQNVCADATEGCINSCLDTAGMGRFPNVIDGRTKKTLDFFANPKAFVNRLANEINKLSKKYGETLCVRLNGTSDIPFENIKIDGKSIFEIFPNVTFYDYTKNPRRATSLKIENYSLTFSRAETELNKRYAKDVLVNGGKVAMVFEKNLYESLISLGSVEINGKTIEVVDGDKNDLRFLDPKNCIVALKAKGKATKDTSGFVIRSLSEI
jgi:hypothetical protein